MRLTEIRTDPRPVAIARVGIGIATILNSLEAYALLATIPAGKVAVPVFEPVLPPTQPPVIALVVLAVAAAIAVTIGWHTEPAALLSVLLSVAILLWDQQTYSSHRLFATLLMAYLVFAKAGSAWSVKRAQWLASVPWWPQLLMMSQLSVLYLFSALSKVNLVFLSGAPLAGWVWLELPRQLYMVAAISTIVVELFIAIGLWFSASRRLSIVLGLGLHTSIVVLMDHDNLALIAFAISCLSLYPLFLHRPAIRSRPAAGKRTIEPAVS